MIYTSKIAALLSTNKNIKTQSKTIALLLDNKNIKTQYKTDFLNILRPKLDSRTNNMH
jgi:hypothetical protein